MFKSTLTTLTVLCVLALLAGCGDGPSQSSIGSATVAPPVPEAGGGESPASAGVTLYYYYVLTPYTSTAWGHSCATWSPKNKAEERAVEKAVEEIRRRYIADLAAIVKAGRISWPDGTTSDVVFTGSPTDEEMAEWYAQEYCDKEGRIFDRIMVSTDDIDRVEVRRGSSCGWDVKVRVDGTGKIQGHSTPY